MTQQIADQGLDILHGLQSKQKDCFHKSTLTIEENCQQLASDETAQMEYALMLTMCELGTAQIQIPYECQSNHSTHHLSSCIKKLASFPQTWTTYSGYYRDVVTICFAVRYPMEKELLQQAQQNMTAYQFESYQRIQQQQQDLYEWRQKEIQLLNSIQLQQSDLWAEIIHLQGVSAGNLLDLISILQDAKYKANDIQTFQKEAMDVNLRYFEDITHKWDRAFHMMNHKFGSLYSQMDEISAWQNRSLVSWTEWQESQDQTILHWQNSINVANQSIATVLNLTEHQLSNLKHDILDIHAGVFTIFRPAQQLFGIMMNFFYNLLRPFVLVGLCWIFPTSPVFTVLKTLALGYQVMSSSQWPSVLTCLGQILALWIECQKKHYPDLFSQKKMTLPVSTTKESAGQERAIPTARVLYDSNGNLTLKDPCQDLDSSSRLELYYRLLVDE